jgi:hypothetical protein
LHSHLWQFTWSMSTILEGIKFGFLSSSGSEDFQRFPIF